MSLPLLRRSATYALQVLIEGRVRDPIVVGTVPREPLTLSLQMRNVDTGELQDYPLQSRVRSDGTFAFFGVPELAFPQIAESSYRLWLEVSAPNYQTRGQEIDVGPTDNQPASVSRSIPVEGIPPMRVRVFTNDLPRTGIDIELDREAVRLRGRVVTTSVPPTGIEGVDLKISEALRTTTDEEGYFEFSSHMPLEQVVVISVSASNFIDERLDYELDYSQPVNELHISLRSAS